jgi:hypothetical protein|tara:strand:+ start:2481 stop:2732 length:252 start_codon:yes stop_codon:yes gene_type:complete
MSERENRTDRPDAKMLTIDSQLWGRFQRLQGSEGERLGFPLTVKQFMSLVLTRMEEIEERQHVEDYGRYVPGSTGLVEAGSGD